MTAYSNAGELWDLLGMITCPSPPSIRRVDIIDGFAQTPASKMLAPGMVRASRQYGSGRGAAPQDLGRIYRKEESAQQSL
jgi:hypothetical protein